MADGAGKTEIYMDMYKEMDKDDRLSAGWTLGEYRKAYSQAFVSAIKEVNLKKTDSSFARASLNIQI